MSKLCAWCGRHFDTEDKRRKYCGETCARRARMLSKNTGMRAIRTKPRREWARHEAEVLSTMNRECGVEELADYVYNSFNKRKGKGSNYG